jgi:hypothetical protein
VRAAAAPPRRPSSALSRPAEGAEDDARRRVRLVRPHDEEDSELGPEGRLQEWRAERGRRRRRAARRARKAEDGELERRRRDDRDVERTARDVGRKLLEV